jgi:hypothetical protein
MSNRTTVLIAFLFLSCATEQKSLAEQNPSALCERLQEIKVMPLKGEPVEDEVYYEMTKAGDSRRKGSNL